MTRAIFLEVYAEELRSRYDWANDIAKFAKFMRVVKEALDGDSIGWLVTGEAVVAAWQAIGGKGKPTLKALRALP